jgi:glycosyltransferase involved in cell wall biosynthesis
MRIVHVLPALTKGGAEHVAIDLANAAVSAGHSVTILTAVLAPPEQAPAAVNDGIERRCLTAELSSPRLVYPSVVPWIVSNRKWLKSQDIVHCHLTFGAVFGTLLELVRGSGRRPAVVETYHATGMAISSLRRRVHAALLGHKDAVAFMADDPFWQRFAAARPHRLFRTIPNGVALLKAIDRLASERYRARIGLPGNVPVVGTISRLLHERRPDLLVDAFAELVRCFPSEVHFLLAGDGPERTELEEQARRLGLARRVHFPGLVLAPQEPLGLIDLYFTVNVGATTGIAALEAAASGVPVIAAQLSPDYLSTAADWIWSSADPREMGARAAALLSDPAALRMLGKKQQRYALEHHSAEAMARAYERLYEDAVARRGTL